MKRRATRIAVLVTSLLASFAQGCTQSTNEVGAEQGEGGSPAAEDVIPAFEVDPMWPQPLPSNWVVGAVIGVAVDSRDHVWIVHRPSTVAEGDRLAAANPPLAECCVPAPPIIEFDPAGSVVQAWGGPGQGYDWPDAEHGLWIDGNDNVWTGGSEGNQILKFTRDGRFMLQIGRPGESKGNSDTENLNRPADIDVDMDANEVYV
ncbi:MAG: hypothetical protein AB7I50_23055, partial [Vicinamibacterales bacterium]